MAGEWKRLWVICAAAAMLLCVTSACAAQGGGSDSGESASAPKAQAWIGTVADGTYYFYQKGDGLYAYRPGEGAEKRIDGAQIGAEWEVNDYGVYYKNDSERSVYVRIHDTGETVTLYTADDGESDSLRVGLLEDGTVAVTVYDLCDERGDLLAGAEQTCYQVLLDGRTGEELGVVTPRMTVNAFYESVPYENRCYQVGERTVVLQEESDGETGRIGLFEEMEPILSANERVLHTAPRRMGDGLLIFYSVSASSVIERCLYLLPDGRNISLSAMRWEGAVDDYLLKGSASTVYEGLGGLQCYDVSTGAYWELIPDAAINLGNIAVSGDYVYSVSGADDGDSSLSAHTLWEIARDEEGKPVGLTLLVEDIAETR